MKIPIIICLFALFGAEAWADGYHGAILPPSSQNIYVTNSQALSIAVAQINPQVNSNAYQMGIGIGSHKGETALAIGIAKRVNKNLLLSGTLGFGDEVGTGIGFNFKF